MKRLFTVAFALTALASLMGPIYAQMSSGESKKTPLQAEYEQKKKAAEKTDQEYQAAMKKTQGQAGPQSVIDPWANMREVDGSQPKR